MEKRTHHLTIALLSVFMLLTACQSKENGAKESQKVKVKVMQVTSTGHAGTSRYSGTVEEENGTALSFAVPGTIKTLHVNLGQRVSAGQLIATLDPTSMQSSYDAAKATLSQAQDAYSRMKQLHDNGSLPEIKWVEVQSKLQQAQAMEEIAKKNLSDCKLYAPFSGWIAEKSVEVGQNVMPGLMVAKLVTASRLNVKIAVPETEIANIPTGCKATIAVTALGGKTFTGIVKEKGVVANPLSRSYDVKLRVDAADADLMPGMVAEVTLNNQGANSTASTTNSSGKSGASASNSTANSGASVSNSNANSGASASNSTANSTASTGDSSGKSGASASNSTANSSASTTDSSGKSGASTTNSSVNSTSNGGESCIIPAHIVQLDEHNNSFVWLAKNGKASKRIVQCGEFTAEGVTILSGLSHDDRIIVEGQQKVCEGTAITF